MPLRATGSLLLCAALLAAAAVFAGCPGAATPDNSIGHSRVGLGCYTDTQCGLDVCNLSTFPGGACVNTCDDAGSCPSDADAGFTQVCLGAPGAGACLRGCEGDGGCLRDGWLCQGGIHGGRVCLPDCRTDPALCPNAGADFQCSTLDGVCRVPLSADAGLFGDCDVFHACAAPNTCLALNGQAGDGGFCTTTCNTDGTDACPASGSCLVSQALPDGGSEMLCGVRCDPNADAGTNCASGLGCEAFAGGRLADGGTIWLYLCAP
jgi:hypothetical protein